MHDAEGPDRPGPPSAPRWVKVFGTLLLLVILAFGLLMVIRGPGGHGPGRHFRGGDMADTAGEARGRGR